MQPKKNYMASKHFFEESMFTIYSETNLADVAILIIENLMYTEIFNGQNHFVAN